MREGGRKAVAMEMKMKREWEERSRIARDRFIQEYF